MTKHTSKEGEVMDRKEDARHTTDYVRVMVRWGLVGLILFVIGSVAAFAQRGYWACGGEYAFLLTPMVAVSVSALRECE